jgi:hypothetical protein
MHIVPIAVGRQAIAAHEVGSNGSQAPAAMHVPASLVPASMKWKVSVPRSVGASTTASALDASVTVASTGGAASLVVAGAALHAGRERASTIDAEAKRIAER